MLYFKNKNIAMQNTVTNIDNNNII